MDYSKTKIVELNLNDVLPNRFQPRIKFNENSIIELSESIKEHGVIQPILVRPIGDKYEIIAGERRYKGAVLAGLSTIPAMIVDSNDKDSAEIALIENVQRQDLNPIEEAISYKKILDMGYLTQEQLAAKLGMSQSAIANKKRLLNLCDEVQEALMEDKISERHARSLLKLSDYNDQKEMVKKIIADRLTVRKLDDEIDKVISGDRSYLDTKIIKGDSVVVEFNNAVSNNPVKVKEPEQEEDEIIDISDLFDDIDFSKLDFIDEIEAQIKAQASVENSLGIISEEEDKEIREMNNRFFNTMDNGMNNTPTTEKTSTNVDVFTPQSSNETIDSSSMFANLMSPNSNSEKIDEISFKNILDPAFVDGAKNNTQINTNVDNNVFSKFVDNNDSTEGGSSISSGSNISGMLSSQTNTTSINDLLAPMGSTTSTQTVTPSVSTINTTPITSIGETNFNDVIKTTPEVSTETSFSKPDLLAPMTSAAPVIEEKPVSRPLSDMLTPDTSFNLEPEPFRPIEEAPVPTESVPVFVTASSTESEFAMPSNPIIDNPGLSSLLTPQVQTTVEIPAPVEEKVEEDPITPVYTPENQARIDLINSINPQIGDLSTSSIIVDDYEKQYDPILPTTNVPKAPQIDLRTVINMVRELNDKIENLGFTIDTDEYDLDDIYQVVIKINKK